MTFEQAFTRALIELRSAGVKRIPVRELCYVHTTEVAKQRQLRLHDEKGRDGKIGALWMDGPNIGKLTQHRRHAERKFIKIRHEDYKLHIHAAKDAERNVDLAARDRAMRAAIPSLISFFEGQVHHLWDTYRSDGMKPAGQRDGRNPTLGYMLDCLCYYARRAFGATVRVPRLRTWTIRDIVIHPTIQKEDPHNYTRRLSADDVSRLKVFEVESDATAIEHFLDTLWRSLKGAKRKVNKNGRESG